MLPKRLGIEANLELSVFYPRFRYIRGKLRQTVDNILLRFTADRRDNWREPNT
jgi:hypothetical protein